MFFALFNFLCLTKVRLLELFLPLLEQMDFLLCLLLALRLGMPPQALVLTLDRAGAFDGYSARLDVIVDEDVLLVVDDVVLVLPNDLHRREDVQCIVDAPLHVLELDAVTKLLV